MVHRDDPRLLPGINIISMTFDAASDPELSRLVRVGSHLTGAEINRFNHIHRSIEDLLAKQDITGLLCHKAVGSAVRRARECTIILPSRARPRL